MKNRFTLSLAALNAPCCAPQGSCMCWWAGSPWCPGGTGCRQQ